jgi:hypothetical protein
VDTADTLRWEASDPDEVSGFRVEVSWDSGRSWRGLTNPGLGAEARAYALTAPCANEGDSVFVRLTAYDQAGGVWDQAETRRRLTPSRLCLPGENPGGVTSFAFLPVAPNPARGSIVFRYQRDGGSLAARGEITKTLDASPYEEPPADLAIHDARGHRVRTFTALPASPLVWDGRDDAGHRLPSGVYFARLRADEHVATQHFVYLAAP